MDGTQRHLPSNAYGGDFLLIPALTQPVNHRKKCGAGGIWAEMAWAACCPPVFLDAFQSQWQRWWNMFRRSVTLIVVSLISHNVSLAVVPPLSLALRGRRCPTIQLPDRNSAAL